MKPHELTGKELGKLKWVTRKILKEAKLRKMEMSKRTAKKLAIKHLGFVDADDYKETVAETGKDMTFKDGIKTALPKYRNL